MQTHFGTDNEIVQKIYSSKLVYVGRKTKTLFTYIVVFVVSKTAIHSLLYFLSSSIANG